MDAMSEMSRISPRRSSLHKSGLSHLLYEEKNTNRTGRKRQSTSTIWSSQFSMVKIWIIIISIKNSDNSLLFLMIPIDTNALKSRVPFFIWGKRHKSNWGKNQSTPTIWSSQFNMVKIWIIIISIKNSDNCLLFLMIPIDTNAIKSRVPFFIWGKNHKSNWEKKTKLL